MNHSYNTISLEEAGSLSVLQLIEMYNDAIETIWYLHLSFNSFSTKNYNGLCLRNLLRRYAMDKKINDVRRDQWRRIVSECLSRDPGLSKAQWCKDNGIRIRSFMYWQRKFRLEAVEQMDNRQNTLPSRAAGTCLPAFADVTEQIEALQADPAASLQSPGASPAAQELMIQTGPYRIYVNGSVQVATLEKVLRVISHA